MIGKSGKPLPGKVCQLLQLGHLSNPLGSNEPNALRVSVFSG